MKTWEIWEQMDKNPNKMVDKKFKLTQEVIANNHIGEIAEVKISIGGTIGLFLNDYRLLSLTGFERWEEVKEPVGFMEILEKTKEDPYLKFKYKNKAENYNFKGSLADFLFDIADIFTNSGIAQILSKGKFYIED